MYEKHLLCKTTTDNTYNTSLTPVPITRQFQEVLAKNAINSRAEVYALVGTTTQHLDVIGKLTYKVPIYRKVSILHILLTGIILIQTLDSNNYYD